MVFSRTNFGTEMEHMRLTGRWLSVLALRLQRPHSGGVLVCWYIPSCAQSPHTRPHRGNTAGFSFLVCKAPQHFLSLQIKWVRASARKLRRLPLAASQTLCLPTP